MRGWLSASMILVLAGCTQELADGTTGALGTPTTQCEVDGSGELAGGHLFFGHVTGTTAGTTGSWTHDTGFELVLGSADWISCRINGVVIADFGGTASIDGASGYAYRVQVQDFGTSGPTSLVLGPPEIQTVSATRRYRPTRWEDGSVAITDRAVVTIPGELPVTVGNAGNMWAWITFQRTDVGDTVRCRYRGGAHNPVPCTPEDLAAGERYHFHDCDSDVEGPLSLAPGDSVDVTSMTLHVHTGAHSLPSRDAAETTVTVDFEVATLTEEAPASDIYRIWVYDPASPTPPVISASGELSSGDVAVNRL